MRKIDNDKMISALLTHGGISAAASALNISRSTIYSRLSDETFREELNRAQSYALQGNLTALSGAFDLAVSTLSRVMSDPTAPHTARVNAASAVLSHYEKLYEIGNLDARLSALEDEEMSA